ncbi:MAG: hypothetical protein PHQ61_06455 [Candidatus Omnitrophica bacterium]|nr:hypothetical protein [Candidatus Omnitrophota bacterium]
MATIPIYYTGTGTIDILVKDHATASISGQVDDISFDTQATSIEISLSTEDSEYIQNKPFDITVTAKRGASAATYFNDDVSISKSGASGNLSETSIPGESFSGGTCTLHDVTFDNIGAITITATSDTFALSDSDSATFDEESQSFEIIDMTGPYIQNRDFTFKVRALDYAGAKIQDTPVSRTLKFVKGGAASGSFSLSTLPVTFTNGETGIITMQFNGVGVASLTVQDNTDTSITSTAVSQTFLSELRKLSVVSVTPTSPFTDLRQNGDFSFVVRALNYDGGLLSSYGGTHTLTFSENGSGSLSTASSSVTFSGGTATVNNVYSASGTISISAAVSGDASITCTAASATFLQETYSLEVAAAASQVQGISFNLTVTALNVLGDPIEADNVAKTLDLSIVDPASANGTLSVSQQAVTFNSSGVATIPIYYTGTGTIDILVKDHATASISGQVDDISFDTQASSLTVELSTDDSEFVENRSFTITVTAKRGGADAIYFDDDVDLSVVSGSGSIDPLTISGSEFGSGSASVTTAVYDASGAATIKAEAHNFPGVEGTDSETFAQQLRKLEVTNVVPVAPFTSLRQNGDFSFVVRALDYDGALLSSYGGTHTITFSENGSGSLSTTSSSVTFSGGLATISNVYSASGTISISAADDDDPTVESISEEVTFLEETNGFGLSVASSSQTQGISFNITITALDEDGHPIQTDGVTKTIDFTLADPASANGTLSNPQQVVTFNSSGVATVSMYYTGTGNISINASDHGNPSTNGSLTGLYFTTQATSLVVTLSTEDSEYIQNKPFDITVTAKRGEATATHFNDAVSISVSGAPGTLSTTSIPGSSFSGGTYTLEGVTFDGKGAAVLNVSCVNFAVSKSVSVTFDEETQSFLIIYLNPPFIQNDDFSFKVRALDYTGSKIKDPSVSRTINFIKSGSVAGTFSVAQSAVTFTNGETPEINLAFSGKGDIGLTVTDDVAGLSSQTEDITVEQETRTFSFDDINSPQVQNEAFQIKLSALKSDNSVSTGYSRIVTIEQFGGNGSLVREDGGLFQLSGGEGTFNVIYTGTGSNITFRASDTADGTEVITNIVGTFSNQITVEQETQSFAVELVDPDEEHIQNKPFQIRISVLDENGFVPDNVYRGPIELTVDGAGSISPSEVIMGPSGVVTTYVTYDGKDDIHITATADTENIGVVSEIIGVSDLIDIKKEARHISLELLSETFIQNEPFQLKITGLKEDGSTTSTIYNGPIAISESVDNPYGSLTYEVAEGFQDGDKGVAIYNVTFSGKGPLTLYVEDTEEPDDISSESESIVVLNEVDHFYVIPFDDNYDQMKYQEFRLRVYGVKRDGTYSTTYAEAVTLTVLPDDPDPANGELQYDPVALVLEHGECVLPATYTGHGYLNIRIDDPDEEALTGLTITGTTPQPIHFKQPVSHFSFSVPDENNLIQNKPFTMYITALDVFNNHDIHYTGTADISFEVIDSPEGGTFTPTSTAAVGFSGGQCYLPSSLTEGQAPKYTGIRSIKVIAKDHENPDIKGEVILTFKQETTWLAVSLLTQPDVDPKYQNESFTINIQAKKWNGDNSDDYAGQTITGIFPEIAYGSEGTTGTVSLVDIPTGGYTFDAAGKCTIKALYTGFHTLIRFRVTASGHTNSISGRINTYFEIRQATRQFSITPTLATDAAYPDDYTLVRNKPLELTIRAVEGEGADPDILPTCTAYSGYVEFKPLIYVEPEIPLDDYELNMTLVDPVKYPFVNGVCTITILPEPGLIYGGKGKVRFVVQDVRHDYISGVSKTITFLPQTEFFEVSAAANQATRKDFKLTITAKRTTPEGVVETFPFYSPLTPIELTFDLVNPGPGEEAGTLSKTTVSSAYFKRGVGTIYLAYDAPVDPQSIRITATDNDDQLMGLVDDPITGSTDVITFTESSNIASRKSGYWDDPETWDLKMVPLSSHNVTINKGHIVTIRPEGPSEEDPSTMVPLDVDPITILDLDVYGTLTYEQGTLTTPNNGHGNGHGSDDGTFGGSCRINLAVNGDINVHDTGWIKADDLGYDKNTTPDLKHGHDPYGSTTSNRNMYYGGSYGSLGGCFTVVEGNSTSGYTAYNASHPNYFPVTYGNAYSPEEWGVGRLSSKGGGAIKLSANNVIVDGKVSADSTVNYGGSGGSVWFIADTVSGEGVISAAGGRGYYKSSSAGTAVGGGSGGRISFVNPSGNTDLTFTGPMSVNGGTVYDSPSGSYPTTYVSRGHAGTIAFPTNMKRNFEIKRTLRLGHDCSNDLFLYNFGNLTIKNRGRLEVDCLPELKAKSNAWYSAPWPYTFILGGNIVVESGGIVSATGLGNDAQRGPGICPLVQSTGYKGPSYGGLSGKISAGEVSTYKYGTYGDAYYPLQSGTGSRYAASGGIVLLYAIDLTTFREGTMTINGTVESNGYPSPSGSTGGSVFLYGGLKMQGSGSVTASGSRAYGDATYYDAGSGGGRIALHADDGEDFTSIDKVIASGGRAYDAQYNGRDGTVYISWLQGLVFTSDCPKTLDYNRLEGPYKIELRDCFGNAKTPEGNQDLVIDLSASRENGCHFYSDPNGTNEISSITIRRWTTRTPEFYFKYNGTAPPPLSVVLRGHADSAYKDAYLTIGILSPFNTYKIRPADGQYTRVAGKPFDLVIGTRDGESFTGTLSIAARKLNPATGSAELSISSFAMNGPEITLTGLEYPDCGTVSFVVSDPMNGETESSSGEFRFVPYTFTVDAPENVEVNDTFDVNLEALNYHSDICPNFLGPVYIRVNSYVDPSNYQGGTITAPTSFTWTSGTATAPNCKYNRWGTLKIECADYYLQNQKGVSEEVNFVPASFNIRIPGIPANRAFFYTGEPFTVRVTARDANNADIENYRGTIIFDGTGKDFVFRDGALYTDKDELLSVDVPEASWGILYKDVKNINPELSQSDFSVYDINYPASVTVSAPINLLAAKIVVENAATVNPRGPLNTKIKIMEDKVGGRIITEDVSTNFTLSKFVLGADGSLTPDANIYRIDCLAYSDGDTQVKNGVCEIKVSRSSGTTSEKVYAEATVDYMSTQGGELQFGSFGGDILPQRWRVINKEMVKPDR